MKIDQLGTLFDIKYRCLIIRFQGCDVITYLYRFVKEAGGHFGNSDVGKLFDIIKLKLRVSTEAVFYRWAYPSY